MDLSIKGWERGLDALAKDAQDKCDELEKIQPQETTRTSRSSTSAPLRREQSDNIGRRVDGILAKVRVNEITLQKVEQNQKQLTEIIQKMDNSLRTENRKLETRLMAALHDKVGELKTYIDSRFSNKGVEGDVGVTPAAIDMDVINSFVTSKLKHGFSRVFEKFTVEVADEQKKTIARMDEALLRERCDFDQLRAAHASVEREVNKLKTDTIRSKSRVDVLEDSYRELSNGVIARDQSAEEAGKRLLSVCRSETHRQLEAVTARVNESLASALDKCAAQLTKADADQRQMRGSMKELGVWRRQVDQQAAMSEQVVVKLFAQIQGLQEGAGALEAAAQDAARRMSALAEINTEHEMRFTSLAEENARESALLDVCSGHIDSLKDTSAAFEFKINQIAEDVGVYAEVALEHQDGLDKINAWGQRTREKVRQLSSHLKQVGKVRVSLERVLELLSQRTHEDAQYFGSLERRLRDLEQAVVQKENSDRNPHTPQHLRHRELELSLLHVRSPAPVPLAVRQDDVFSDSDDSISLASPKDIEDAVDEEDQHEALLAALMEKKKNHRLAFQSQARAVLGSDARTAS